MMITEAAPEEIYVRQSHDPNCQIVDLRNPKQFARAHIPAALNIPASELDAEYNRVSNERTAYLVSQSNDQAVEAALSLARHGDRNTCVLKGGMRDWQRAKLPVEGSTRRPVGGKQLIVLGSAVIMLSAALAFLFDATWILVPILLGLYLIQIMVAGSVAAQKDRAVGSIQP